MIKTKGELALLRKAARISNSCIPIIEKSLKENGVTEREISKKITKKIYSLGGKLSFRPLVACGNRSYQIHPKPNSTNNLISGIGYVDFGASYKGYKTDVTVPFIKGKIGSRERRVVKAVVDSYKFAVKSSRVGMHCWELHRNVDDFLISRGFKMGHALGHGLGKNLKESYHEGPIIYAPSREILRKLERKAANGSRKARRKIIWWHRIRNLKFQKNMCVAIEPGVYVKNVGGSRIENSFWASGKNLKALTKAKLIEV